MINYRRAGDVPQRTHAAFRSESGELRYEHCFTRDGFDGPFSILYHEQPPQNHTEGTSHDALWAFREERNASRIDALRRRHFKGFEQAEGGTTSTGRLPLMFNNDITVGVLHPSRGDDFYFANGDGDDLFYVQHGGGTLISPFGRLRFSAGDYVFIPRAVAHRFELDSIPQFWFWTECRTGMHIPRQYRNPVGQLRMDAPYSHRDFRAPELDGPVDPDGPRQIISKRRDRFTSHRVPHSPLDVVGWDGMVWPFAFHIKCFRPKIAAYHLPPTVHGTFATKGSLICSFVPRMVDFGEDAIPCPYPHSNVDVDEVIFYCDGDFTSRRGLNAGSLSFHPAGIPHGPHPGAYERSIGTTRADELAVMIDTFDPLRHTVVGTTIEDTDYDESWSN